jgi:hypothetical protein
MAANPAAEIIRLRTALRELVALSTITAAWVGREPPTIAAGLADVLVASLELDFAFVRFCDPKGCKAVEVMRGDSWKAFPEWLQQRLAVFGQI